MHCISKVGLSMLGLATLVGCGDPNAGALFADIQYATRCAETIGACPGAEDRDICGFHQSDPCRDGDAEATLACTVVETETTRTVNFSATQSAGFSITVQNLAVPRGGGSSTGGACRVRIGEGANVFEGLCGGSPPSEAQPCQISNVVFSDDMGNPTITGNIFCDDLKNQANPNLEIEVTAVGPGPGPAGMPGRFRLANCSGQTLP